MDYAKGKIRRLSGSSIPDFRDNRIYKAPARSVDLAKKIREGKNLIYGVVGDSISTGADAMPANSVWNYTSGAWTKLGDALRGYALENGYPLADARALFSSELKQMYIRTSV